MSELLQSPADLDVEAARAKPNDRTAQLRAFMAIARERFMESASSFGPLRSRMLEDRRFASGEAQWTEADEKERMADGRPVLKINRTPSFIKQVTNSIREARPAIEYVPVEDADEESAEILQGLARHVESNSDADIAYETAMEHQVEMGMGWFHIRADFVHDATFEQDIFIERIRNPFTVYPDPAAKKFDFSDMRYCFIVEDIPISSYKRDYSQRAVASLNDFGSIGDNGQHWFNDKTVRVASYYYLDYEDKTLVMVRPMPGEGGTPPDPMALPAARFEDTLTEEEKPYVMPGQFRKVRIPVVKWAKINGVDILEGEVPAKEGDFPIQGRAIAGLFIPVVPVLGDERDINGELDYRGMVRDIKDAQRQVNYWQTAITEAIALSPKAPFIIAEGQITVANKHFWEQANRKNFAYLPYAPLTQNGQTLPPPQRNTAEPAIQAMVVANQIAEANLRAIAGFYDVQTREQDLNNQSGRAIMARREQAERGNSNFHGNLARSIRHAGRILLYMFPVIYDTARVKRIVGGDNIQKEVMVFAGETNAPKMLPKGVKKAFDLSTGRYDVRTVVGPSYATKRREALEAGMELVKALPAIAQVGGDIIVRNIDAPGMAELAKRLKKVLVPKEAFEDDAADPEAKLQKMESQLQELGQMFDLLTKELNAKSDYIQTEQIKHESVERQKRIDADAKILIAGINAKTQLALATIKGQQAEDAAVLQADIDRANLYIDSALQASAVKQQSEIDLSRDREQRAFDTMQQQNEQQMQQGGPGGQPPEGQPA